MAALRITSVLCLASALLMLPVLFAQDENPFAQWERLQKQTELTQSAEESAEPKAKRAVQMEYFSGESEPAQTTSNKSPARRETLKRKAPVGQLETEPESEVTVADFESDDAEVQITLIKSEADANDGNPFEEFAEEFEANNDGARIPVQAVEAVTAEDFEPAEEITLDEPEAIELTDPLTPESAPDAVSQISLPEGPQSPAVTLQWVHHDEFSVGQKCRCDLVVENTGRSLVHNVITRAVLTQALQVVDAKPAPVASGASASWQFDMLKPGEKKTIELTVVPRQEGDTQMRAFVQLTGATSSKRAVTRPAVAIDLDGPENTGIGQQVAYTVAVTNPGTGTARNVIIQAAIPEGLKHRQGSLLTIDVGTLSPGEVRRARLNLEALRGGIHNLAVRVLADGDLTEQTAQQVSIAEPKLNIGVRGPASSKTGQSSPWELVIVNEGKVESSNVRTKYRVPTEYEFVRANAGGKFNPADRTIEWFVGNLEPNGAQKFTVVLKAVKPGENIHQVGVVSEHGGMTLAEQKSAVVGSADLNLQIATQQQRVRTGEPALFVIQIENRGSSAAQSVGLSCELPSGLQQTEVAGPARYLADNGVIVFQSLPQLAPGQKAVFTIKTTCLRSGNHKLRVRVGSDSISDPLIGEESLLGLER